MLRTGKNRNKSNDRGVTSEIFAIHNTCKDSCLNLKHEFRPVFQVKSKTGAETPLGRCWAAFGRWRDIFSQVLLEV